MFSNTILFYGNVGTSINKTRKRDTHETSLFLHRIHKVLVEFSFITEILSRTVVRCFLNVEILEFVIKINFP